MARAGTFVRGPNRVCSGDFIRSSATATAAAAGDLVSTDVLLAERSNKRGHACDRAGIRFLSYLSLALLIDEWASVEMEWTGRAGRRASERAGK